VRVALVAFAQWQDEVMVVKYTDIDYVVFTDAARFVSEGASPYSRATYRYTPLLAYLLLPNITLSPLFGKLLFALVDLLIGALLHDILARHTLAVPHAHPRALAHTALWLLNPFVINVSTRGNAEAVVSFCVVACLWAVACKRVLLAGVMHGLAIHLKIYPVIFSAALFLYIGKEYTNSNAILNSARITAVLGSGATLAALTALFYYAHGWDFIYETYLYHLVRADTRHNLSVYFYQLYVGSSVPGAGAAVLAFLPQAGILAVTSLALYRHLHLCVFVQTFAFVMFNKVCTVQYFVWYFAMLPLVTPHLRMSPLAAGNLAAFWVGSQALWFFYAYHLEFLGENTFAQICAAGVAFFAANCAILVCVIRAFEPKTKVKTG